MDQALRGKMCARMREVQTQVAERDELIEVIAIALLTRKKCLCPGATPGKPKALSSTCSAMGSPGLGSLSA